MGSQDHASCRWNHNVVQIEQAEHARAIGLIGKENVLRAARVEQRIESAVGHGIRTMPCDQPPTRNEPPSGFRRSRAVTSSGCSTGSPSICAGMPSGYGVPAGLVAEGWVVTVWVGDGGVKTVGVLEEVGVGAGMGAVVPGGVGGGTAGNRTREDQREQEKQLPRARVHNALRSSVIVGPALPVWLCDEDQLDFAVHLPRVAPRDRRPAGIGLFSLGWPPTRLPVQ